MFAKHQQKTVFQGKPAIYRLLVAVWLLVFVVCVTWLPDAFHSQIFDVHCANFFADILLHSPRCADIIHILNGGSEPVMNIIVMLLCQCVWCGHLPKAQRAYCWHQIVVCFLSISVWLHVIIKPLVSFTKVSPVLMIPYVHDTVVQLFGPKYIIGSLSCLASGHAFALFYSLFYFVHDRGSSILKCIIALLAVLFSFHRVVIGEHWVSDYGCSILLAYICVQFVKASGLECHVIRFWQRLWLGFCKKRNSTQSFF